MLFGTKRIPEIAITSEVSLRVSGHSDLPGECIHLIMCDRLISLF